MMIDFNERFSASAGTLQASAIREMLKLLDDPAMISFAGGMPDPRAFPREALTAATAHLMRDHLHEAMQYGTTEGHRRLRGAIADGMRSLFGTDFSAENILITSGAQQGLAYLCKALLDPGDTVLVESPTFAGALLTFRACGARLESAPTDAGGLRTNLLADQLTELSRLGRRPKLLYTIPTVHNPSGTVMPLARREALLALAERFDLLVVEDDPYSLLTFADERPPLLTALDRGRRTLYLGTFSKLIAPGLRVGWLAAPRPVTAKAAVIKQAEDLCTNSFGQHCVFELLRSADFLPHVRRVAGMYQKKCRHMESALRRHLPKSTRWVSPAGGLFLWLTLPDRIASDTLLPQAIAAKVAYVAGSAFHADNGGTQTLRLNFSYADEETIEEGVRRLGVVIAAS